MYQMNSDHDDLLNKQLDFNTVFNMYKVSQHALLVNLV